MREKRLKLFLYDISINYSGRIEITNNLLLLLNTFIRNISSREELQRFLLVFDHEETEDGYKVKYQTSEIVEANESLQNETIESILDGISNEEALEVGILASNFIEHMYNYCYMMTIPTYTKRLLN